MLAVIKERSRGARRCFRLLSVGFVSVGEMLKTVSRGFKKNRLKPPLARCCPTAANLGQKKKTDGVCAVGSKTKLHIYMIGACTASINRFRSR